MVTVLGSTSKSSGAITQFLHFLWQYQDFENMSTIKRNIDCDAEHKNKKVTASERTLWKNCLGVLCPTRQGVDGRKQTKDEKSDLETKARGDGSRSVITTSSESGQRTCHTWTRAHCTRPVPPTSAPALSTRGPLHFCV